MDRECNVTSVLTFFLVSMLLIATGIAVAHFFSVQEPLVVINGSGWSAWALTILGAFFSVRLSLYYQRKDEFCGLIDDIDALIHEKVDRWERAWEEENVFSKSGKYTNDFYKHFFLIAGDFNILRRKLKNSGHSEILMLTSDAFEFYSELSSYHLTKPENKPKETIVQQTLLFRKRLKTIKPSRLALLMGNRIPKA